MSMINSEYSTRKSHELLTIYLSRYEGCGCSQVVGAITAGSKTIDQNRPIHTYALSFSPGIFAAKQWRTLYLVCDAHMSTFTTPARAIPCLDGLDVLLLVESY